jgi:hypothetical protein
VGSSERGTMHRLCRPRRTLRRLPEEARDLELAVEALGCGDRLDEPGGDGGREERRRQRAGVCPTSTVLGRGLGRLRLALDGGSRGALFGDVLAVAWTLDVDAIA